MLHTGRQEYLIRWKQEDEEDSWEPEFALGNAETALAEFLARRAREAEAATAAAESKAKQAEQDAQQRLQQEWRDDAVGPPIAKVKERIEQLELKGVRVVVPPTA